MNSPLHMTLWHLLACIPLYLTCEVQCRGSNCLSDWDGLTSLDYSTGCGQLELRFFLLYHEHLAVFTHYIDPADCSFSLLLTIVLQIYVEFLFSLVNMSSSLCGAKIELYYSAYFSLYYYVSVFVLYIQLLVCLVCKQVLV